MTADDLITWLRAVYDERERTALAAGGRGPGGQWHTADDAWAGRVEDAAGNIVVYDEGSPTEAQAAHIAGNDPADELRDLDAKRRILDEHKTYDVYSGFGCGICAFNGRDGEIEPEGWCTTVRLVALPYADRPGYREEWAPDA